VEQIQQELRDVRARWRQRQVLDAAVRLMSGGGFRSVSMQALAQEADVSVGLIYSYFGGKEDVVVAVVVDVCAELRAEIDARMAAAGTDPVERLVAAFAASCAVLDEHRNAGLLTYRQSAELGPEARAKLKAAERTTLDPLVEAMTALQTAGLLVEGVDTGLVAFDLMIFAQVWALKHWHFADGSADDGDVTHYLAGQTATVLRSVLTQEAQRRYQHLIRKGH
jgi:AcrR family transcriptional regulator